MSLILPKEQNTDTELLLREQIVQINVSKSSPTFLSRILDVISDPLFLPIERIMKFKNLLWGLLQSNSFETLNSVINLFNKGIQKHILQINQSELMVLNNLLLNKNLLGTNKKQKEEILCNLICLIGSTISQEASLSADFIFVSVCRMIQNYSKKVRTTVCRTLPQLSCVSITLLLDTLEKLDFSALDTITARGTFVQALDDEYHEVIINYLYVLGQRSCNRSN